jgi:competence protein ComEC
LAFVVGVLLGPRLGGSPAALALFLLAAVLVVPLAISLRWRLVPVLMLPALALGVLRAGTFEPDHAASLAQFHGSIGHQVEGVVLSEPDSIGSVSRLRLAVERVRDDDGGPAWTRAPGTILATLKETVEIVEARDRPFFRYGDRLMLTGALAPPPELDDFDYPAFLARQGIGTVMEFPDVALLNTGEGAAFRRWVLAVRNRLAASLDRAVPEPQASFGQAILLGIRDGLPNDTVEDFRVSGTSHILAISGLHISVLLGISLAASALAFGRRRQAYLVVPLLLIWGYALVSGAQPSAVRAAIMGTAYLGALAVGRPGSIQPALALAAAVMVAIDPDALSSVSFQLSFAAMAGIALLNRPLAEWLESALAATPDKDGLGPSLLRPVIELATVSVAATVAVLPLVAFYFERVSLVGLPATLLAMPAMPLALAAHASAASIGLVADWAAQPAGWVAWAASAYIAGIASTAARLPGAAWETGRLAPVLVWCYYVALTAALFARPALRLLLRRGRAARLLRLTRGLPSTAPVPWLVVALVVTLASLSWTAVAAAPSGTLRVVFADIGQGDMALITTPGGHRVVVDGGPNGAAAAGVLGSALRFWERSIDLVVLTHPHSDHVSGLTELLRRYDVRRVLERAVEYDSPQYVEWRRAVDAEDTEVVRARPGQQIAFDDGVRLEVIGPPDRLLNDTVSDTDNASVVLRLVYGEVSFLLTGDLFEDGEAFMLRHDIGVDSDVLKVAHHGSDSSSSPSFLSAVSPAAAVISAGAENRFGHPDQGVLDRLARHVPPGQVYVTSEHGAVTFVTDGRTLSVHTER